MEKRQQFLWWLGILFCKFYHMKGNKNIKHNTNLSLTLEHKDFRTLTKMIFRYPAPGSLFKNFND